MNQGPRFLTQRKRSKSRKDVSRETLTRTSMKKDFNIPDLDRPIPKQTVSEMTLFNQSRRKILDFFDKYQNTIQLAEQ